MLIKFEELVNLDKKDFKFIMKQFSRTQKGIMRFKKNPELDNVWIGTPGSRLLTILEKIIVQDKQPSTNYSMTKEQWKEKISQFDEE